MAKAAKNKERWNRKEFSDYDKITIMIAQMYGMISMIEMQFFCNCVYILIPLI